MPEEPKSFSSLSELLKNVYNREKREEKITKKTLGPEGKIVYIDWEGNIRVFPFPEEGNYLYQKKEIFTPEPKIPKLINYNGPE